MTEKYEEPPGYSLNKGSVKSNPDNNDAYVAEWEDDPWYPAIYWCHEQLKNVVPNYNIAQIKEKFGGLRFYVDLPSEEDIDWDKVPPYLNRGEDRMGLLWNWSSKLTIVAEAWVSGYEAAKREEVK